MLENFERVRKQLIELSKVLNAFQSEAVQLRLVDFLLGKRIGPEQEEVEGQNEEKNRRRKKTNRKTKPPVVKKKDRKSTGKPNKKRRIGGYSMIDILIEEGFFETKRTINDVIKYCDTNKAIKYKAGDFSGKFGSLVANGTLNREKNSEKQYEYWQ